MKLDELISESVTIEKIKGNAISEVEKLKEIGKEIRKLEEAKWKELRLKCMNEAKEFFESGEFEVERNEKRIIAKLENIIISVKDESEDEMLVFPIEIKAAEKYYSSIEIRPCLDDIDMIYQKNCLKIKDNIVDFNNYVEVINKCNDKEELFKVIERTKENIEHYKNTIIKFKDIKYIYSIYDAASIECSSFREVFEEHIN